ncbi:MAG: hypothetical protein OEY14_16295 [Myxococcales bacterium]|nr:hypothetical protein [Myxococcales bacterium]
MSLLKRIFGGGSSEAQRARADALFEEGAFGIAKLAYEKALRSADEATRAEIEARIDQCLDAIAEQRQEAALRLREEGTLDHAREELLGAIEVAASESVRERARMALDALEREDAMEQAAPPAELDDAELFALISARWEPGQAEEYDAYDDRFVDARLHLEKGAFAEARELFEALVEEAAIPRFLRFELARACLGMKDTETCARELRAFLESLDPDEGGLPRLAAHHQLAELSDEAGDEEAALDEYQAAIEAFEDDYRPLLLMGNFLRRKGRPEEAVEILEEAARSMDELRPDFQTYEALGLALRDADRKPEAIVQLEQVVSIFAERGHLDLPPVAAEALAELHEEAGALERAADLYSMLARGSGRARHALYHRQAGRVLLALGLFEDARRMLQRAHALSADDAEALGAVEALLAELAEEP